MLFFEQFNVAGLFMCEQSILSLYSVGKTTGTVVDLGHGKTGAPASLKPLSHTLIAGSRPFSATVSSSCLWGDNE